MSERNEDKPLIVSENTYQRNNIYRVLKCIFKTFYFLAGLLEPAEPEPIWRDISSVPPKPWSKRINVHYSEVIRQKNLWYLHILKVSS